MNSGQLRGLVETKGVDPAVEASCLQSALTGEELSALLVDPAAGSLMASAWSWGFTRAWSPRWLD